MTDPDDRLEQTLQEDAQRWRHDFTPPPLAAAMMRLDTEPDDRGAPLRSVRTPAGHGWWRPLAVAAVVLVVIGGVVTATQRRHDASEAPSDSSTVAAVMAVPPTYDYQGATWHLLRQVAFSLPTIDGPDAHTAVVRAGQAAPPSDCSPLTTAFLTASTATLVTITAAQYAPPPAPPPSGDVQTVCADVGYPPLAIPVDLGAPLGSRSLVDGESGTVQTPLDTTRVPTLTSVPSGYTGGSVVPGGGFDSQGGAPSRSWVKGDQSLTLQQVSPDRVTPAADDVVLLTGTVDGHPAVVKMTRNWPDNVRVVWQQDATTAWTLINLGPPKAKPTAVELLAAAQSFAPGS